MTRTGGAAPAPTASFARRVLDAIAVWLDAEQDRLFLWLPVALGAGIAVYFVLAAEPLLWPALTALVAVLVMRRVAGDSLAAMIATGALVATAGGFALAKLRTETVRAPVLTRAIGPVIVEGWIEIVEARPERGERITLRVHRIEGLPPESWPARIRVRATKSESPLGAGDAVRFRALLSPPPGPALPGDHDFARQAWFLGIGAVGSTRSAPERIAIEGMPWSLRWRAPIERLRQAIGARVQAALPGETGAIAAALITGERGAISDATNEAYRDSGLLHILSISGLHMTIMAGAVFLAVRFLLALWPALALRFEIKKWAAVAAAIGALAYLLISGSAFPAVRSYIMISIMFLAILLDRPALALRNVALAALVILVIWPESLIDVSFQMSFAAVLGLVAAYELIRTREAERTVERSGRSLWRTIGLMIGGILVSTLVVSITVAPFAAYHFHKSQQYAMLANLIAVPICNLLVMPMALAALVAMPFGLEAPPLWLMGLGIDAMTWTAYKVAALPGAVTRIPAIPTAAFALMVIGGLWTCLWQTRLRWLGVVPFLAGLGIAPFRQAPDVYVGREGNLVVVRGEGRLLTALADRRAMFELGRILEHDGDGRRLEDVTAARGFRCDWSGCIVTVRERRIAVVRHAAAALEDCRTADIVVMAGSPGRDGACRRPGLVTISARELAAFGPHALYLGTGNAVRTETAADWRGVRPWSTPRPGAPVRGPLATIRAPAAGRLAEPSVEPDR